MPSIRIDTPGGGYTATVERGVIERAGAAIPLQTSRVFVVTTEDVWHHQGDYLEKGLTGVPFEILHLPGGEERKRLAPLEDLAEQMVMRGGDRRSVIIAFGGGIVTDMGGFLAAIFMRGVPVIQIPTTLLAQVDAAVGGKTGVNLVNGKNLIGSFHQPIAVLVDPAAVETLPEREYRAGLFEVIKHGVIASEPLFRLFDNCQERVLARESAAVDRMIEESVRIKAAVVSEDERETGRRRILNFGHTFGHALEAETEYKRFLHGEAVAWGMRAATLLAMRLGMLTCGPEILDVLMRYGPLPDLSGISAESIEQRLLADKKTHHGQVHFVLPVRVGEVVVRTGVERMDVMAAIEQALN